METTKIENLVETILRKSFPGDSSRQKIYLAGNRINFSCPYCGDSSTSRKKRGNFYLTTLCYKCYNGGCGIFKDGYDFFSDFEVLSDVASEDRQEILRIIKEGKQKRKTHYGDVDISLLFEIDFKKCVIPRDDFVQRLKLQDVENSAISGYLKRRNQVPDQKFAWDPTEERLFLFNLTKDQEILGLQVRTMSKSSRASKYYTYKLSGIWEKMLGETNPDFLDECCKIDPVSHVFNIGQISFDRTITIFEGPMDSWFWENSVALCSIENKFPFEFDDIRFWYDWDKAGRTKSLEMLTRGDCVFNWKKFLEDHNLPLDKKWDLNDLVNHLRIKKMKVKRFEDYFTRDTLDLTYFIEV
jgi:predicted RNA-binding Zn-ribbon protein involved in translation (DUF1610 family)